MRKCNQEFITVVSGLPRSGTSMMMQMLEAGGMPVLTDHVRQANEDNPRGYYELEAVKRTKDDSSWTEQGVGKAVKLIYLLLYDLPANYDYRVIFMQRNHDEVLASQQVMLERRGQKGASVSNENLLRVFSDQLAKIEQWLIQQPNFNVLYLEYKDVVRDASGSAEKINEFVGGTLDIQAMATSVDPGLRRQRSTG